MGTKISFYFLKVLFAHMDEGKIFTLLKEGKVKEL